MSTITLTRLCYSCKNPIWVTFDENLVPISAIGGKIWAREVDFILCDNVRRYDGLRPWKCSASMKIHSKQWKEVIL